MGALPSLKSLFNAFEILPRPIEIRCIFLSRAILNPGDRSSWWNQPNSRSLKSPFPFLPSFQQASVDSRHVERKLVPFERNHERIFPTGNVRVENQERNFRKWDTRRNFPIRIQERNFRPQELVKVRNPNVFGKSAV